ncbi:hypothetical protein [Caminicella sporogenes]|uniref:hypothetical protein n=1 Tax=Caminicella sporogenes TaxID=166485 RepID=UPI0025400222|nr:hypothetical protein [Caminicella sporogenes]WIF95041.1 hypothetical protein QNI18_12385 [Caminicella sporogenes]WIF95153.1 hypothetical protein QNI18_00505 [Caminicella sporogenes]
MGKLYEIAKKQEKFALELAKAVEEITLKYGLPYRVVLEKAQAAIDKRCEDYEAN